MGSRWKSHPQNHQEKATKKQSFTQAQGRLKAKVALEAAAGEKTTAQIAAQYGVHPSQITAWKKVLLEKLPELFEHGNRKAPPDAAAIAALHAKIGQQSME